MSDKFKSLKAVIGGALAGVANGLLGAGGGMLAVPSLMKCGLDRKAAHRNSVAVILPLSVLSAAMYIKSGNVSFGDSLPYLPWGAVGAALGSLALKRLPENAVRRIFAAFMIFAGIRLFLR